MIFIVSVTGCSKDETEERSQDGILIRVEAPTINGWSTEKMTGTRNLETNTARQKGEDGLDMKVDLRPDYEGTAGKEATTRWTNIDNNTTFRVVAYRCDAASGISTSNYAGYGDYKLSDSRVQTTTRNLILPPGTYTFVCYSYGDNRTLSVFSNTSTSVSASNGENFMTYVRPGVIINNAGSTYTLNGIVFKHHCARYRILAKAQRGRMGKITACGGTLTVPRSNATYNFTTNSFNTTDSGTLNVTWSNLNDGMNVYSNYTYLIPQSSADIIVALNLTIGGKVFANKSVTLSRLTLTANKTYYSSVSFTTEGYILGGSFWARGNLYYENGNFKFFESTWENSTNRLKNYWRWDALRPTDAFGNSATTWNSARDPCKKVEGAGWRLPTTQEFENLIAGNKEYAQFNNKDGLWIDDILFLPCTGYFLEESGFESNLILPDRGLYWAKERVVNYGNMLDFRTGNGPAPSISYLPWINNSDKANHCMAIRCVRAD